jgi:hypothetical protein
MPAFAAGWRTQAGIPDSGQSSGGEMAAGESLRSVLKTFPWYRRFPIFPDSFLRLMQDGDKDHKSGVTSANCDLPQAVILLWQSITFIPFSYGKP